MDAIVVVLIVSVAVGYLVRRYVKKTRIGGGCRCENMECPLNGGRVSEAGCQRAEVGDRKSECHTPFGGSEQIEKCDGVVCGGKKCNDEPFQKV